MSKIIPLEDFFRNTPESFYSISPDGKNFAFLAPYQDRMNIFVRPCCFTQNAENSEPVQLTFETSRSIEGYAWVDNERILFVKDNDGDENYKLYGVKIDGSDLRAYTNFEGVRTFIIDTLKEVPDEIIIGMNRRNPEAFDPYRLNLKTGEMKMLAENPGNWSGWMTDHDGKLRVVHAIVDGVNTQILYRETEDEPFRPVLTTNFREGVEFINFTPDNKKVWASTNINRDKDALVLMDPATCEELEVLYENPKYDIGGISYSSKRKCLEKVFCCGHKGPIHHYFDEEAKTRREKVEKHFPGMRVGIIDLDDSEENCILRIGSDNSCGAYYFYNINEDKPHLIAKLMPWLNEEDLVHKQPINYTTRDGLEIDAYLSLPKDVEPKNLPLIVNPHGGPWSRDYWGYSSQVQFLCNRGYAVLQMNFRGSTGYGRKFLEASYKEWGRKMQDDITDGVKYVIEQGIADPKRIGIYGASYGGYATLAGLCFTPDLYCCGVDYVGVSNLLTFMNTIPPYWKRSKEIMYEKVGNPETEKEFLEAVSPALHADKIRVPLMIAQGANDPRVNKAESDQMVEALRKRGVEVDYMVKDNEGHGFANQENCLDFYRAMETFLKKHM